MATVAAFRGFAPALIDFLNRLAAHNQRDWFEAHRADYQAVLLEPARQFVIAMGHELAQLGDDIHAEPRVRGSILPINRDTRFSTDQFRRLAPLQQWLVDLLPE
jgi:uncharacterized protein (DUF2461 family)